MDFESKKKLSFKRRIDPGHTNFKSFDKIEITAKLTWSSDLEEGFKETLEEKTISIFTGI